MRLKGQQSILGMTELLLLVLCGLVLGVFSVSTSHDSEVATDQPVDLSKSPETTVVIAYISSSNQDEDYSTQALTVGARADTDPSTEGPSNHQAEWLTKLANLFSPQADTTDKLEESYLPAHSSLSPGKTDYDHTEGPDDGTIEPSGYGTQSKTSGPIGNFPADDGSVRKTKPVTDSSSGQTFPADASSTPSSPTAAHPCLRECVQDSPPMTCFYVFEVEGYLSMSKACDGCPTNSTDCEKQDCIPADGAKRPLIVVNRQLPGPSIEVCYGDQVIVDVVNLHMEQSVTIHWHGIHQVGSPYMDGVPYVTQCPIEPGMSFRYNFTASPAGTYFWHSHLGVQRANGLFGALIVRIPTARDPNKYMFDYDIPPHTIQVLDWDHVTSADKFMAHLHGGGDNKPPTLLVNGRGRNYEIETSSGTASNVYVPIARFNVKQGGRYRFRLINAGFLNCPIQLSVDSHNITVIGSDSSLLQPLEAESLVSYAGERFDFVIKATQPVNNYWLRFRGLMNCDDSNKAAHQVAVLHYEGAPDRDPEGEVSYEAGKRQGLQINSLNVGLGEKDSVLIPELNSAVGDDVRLKPEADLTFYVSYEFYKLDNPLFHKHLLYGYNEVLYTSERTPTPQLNHISMKLPPAPLLSQLSDLDPSSFCNSSSVDPSCSSQYCECAHLLRVPLGAVVELFIIDEGSTPSTNHPFHLHGTDFRVVAMDLVGPNTTEKKVKDLDKSGLIRRKLKAAPIKDVITTPHGGYTVVRFQATNPGMWIFHCHIDFHSEIGMALVFEFGEPKDFPPVPEGFPKCGNSL